MLPVIVMELMHSSLRNYVESVEQSKRTIPYGTKLSILQDVARALRYIHHQNPAVVHRDLSPNNVLLTDHLVAKLSDLGVAKAIKADSKKTMTKLPGTSDFMPPEALDDGSKYGPPLDIFSYGGVSLYLASEQWPTLLPIKQFDPNSNKLVVLSEIERRQAYIDKIPRKEEKLKHLIISCLDDNPNVRPTTVKVLDVITELVRCSVDIKVDQEISKLSISAESYYVPQPSIADPQALRKTPINDHPAGSHSSNEDQYSGDAGIYSRVTHTWAGSSTTCPLSTRDHTQGVTVNNRQSFLPSGSNNQYSERQEYQQPRQQHQWLEQQYQRRQQQQYYQQQYQQYDQKQTSKPSEWCKSSGCHFPALPECENFCFPCYKTSKMSDYSQVKCIVYTQIKQTSCNKMVQPSKFEPK